MAFSKWLSVSAALALHSPSGLLGSVEQIPERDPPTHTHTPPIALNICRPTCRENLHQLMNWLIPFKHFMEGFPSNKQQLYKVDTSAPSLIPHEVGSGCCKTLFPSGASAAVAFYGQIQS